jgi:light-regulated signal transduction histidine kinase (bacteriophytochrome)
MVSTNESSGEDEHSKTDRYFIFRSLRLIFDGKECNMVSIRDVTLFKDLRDTQNKNQYLNMLTATVTHELMSPINCIITFSKTIYSTLPNDIVKHSSKKIFDCATLMKMHVRSLLDRASS